ncbi:MAG: glycosyl hydrolase family 79 C-terminal domain-containing protein, partial [Solirubrobacteraceae bacterium]
RVAAAPLAIAAVAVAVLLLILGGAGAGAKGTMVSARQVGRPIPPGFVGLSIEPKSLEQYAGTDAAAIDPVFVALLRAIAPGQSSVLRIGGDGTDWSWWPVPGVAQPGGVKYSLTPRWMAVARALTGAVAGRLILGVDLEADSIRVAAAEAHAMVSRIGAGSIDALELGNEPELYGTFGWYRSASGRQVPGRPRGYSVADFTHDFTEFAPHLAGAPLAGPASGAPAWLAQLGSFLRAEPRVKLATIHAYPLKHCVRSTVVTKAQLLADSSSHGLAQRLAGYLQVARANRDELRIDELNGVSCGGTRGVSDTFASALWVLDTLFELARVGFSGVNVHSVPGTINELLGPSRSGGSWHMRVHPEFYGMMMFAQAAPPGSRLLSVRSAVPAGVKLWATRGPGDAIHVVAINKRLSRPVRLSLRIAGARGPASVMRLLAPSVGATSGVTLGGQSFGAQTSTGLLSGPASAETVTSSDDVYRIRVAPASAAMLTLAGS